MFEDETQETIALGQQARTILDSEAFNRAIRSIEETLMHYWRESDHPEQREKIHSIDQALGLVQAGLRQLVARGEVEEHRLESENHGLARVLELVGDEEDAG
jgi:hypothetical protein